MARGLYNFGVKALPGTKMRFKAMQEWPERLKHIEPMVPYMAADYMKRYLKAHLPKGEEQRGYRQGLEVVKVVASGAEHAYAVQIDPKNRYVKMVKTARTLLYIHPKKRAARPNQIGLILEKYNPWTFDSLPISPDAKYVDVIKKKALPKLVHDTTEKRRRQKREWGPELVHAGVRKLNEKGRLRVGKIAHTVPGFDMEALRLEFGDGKNEPKPLWRLALQHLKRGGIKALSRDKRIFVYPFTRPSFRMWEKWPPKTKHKLPKMKAKRFMAFQRKIRGS
jgi:hypothetical protein